MNYGVIDLGSNSIRLVIYDVDPRRAAGKSQPGKIFRSIINDKVVAGLSAYVEDGAFTNRGVERAAEVLSGHLKRARYFNCKRIDVFATAVLRNCKNSKEAVKAIEKAIAHPISLLSARDEAHLSFVGASCDRMIDNATVVDLGGGSCELIRVKDGVDTKDVSIGQGSLSSYAGFVANTLPDKAERTAIERGFLEQAKATVGNLDDYRAQKLYGVGGSTRAAAKLYAQAFGSGIRPKALTAEHFDRIFELLVDDPARFAHEAARAVPERIHTVVPGCVILSTLLRELKATSLEVCKRGVREGYLIERMLR